MGWRFVEMARGLKWKNREHRLASPLSYAGHQRHLRNQATSGPPRRTGFVRDAGGF